MRHWVSSGQYNIGDIISSDGLHMNDVSYGCVAHLLADSIAAAAKPGNNDGRHSEGAQDASR
jgi:hypothetical protein